MTPFISAARPPEKALKPLQQRVMPCQPSDSTGAGQNCVFRRKPPLVPFQSHQPFRLKSATSFGESDNDASGFVFKEIVHLWITSSAGLAFLAKAGDLSSMLGALLTQPSAYS